MLSVDGHRTLVASRAWAGKTSPALRTRLRTSLVISAIGAMSSFQGKKPHFRCLPIAFQPMRQAVPVDLQYPLVFFSSQRSPNAKVSFFQKGARLFSSSIM